MTKSMDNTSNLRHSAGLSAIVEQEYLAKEAGELSLNRGAIIQNVRQQPNGLWEGSLAGKTGLFRESCVRFLDSATNSASGDRDGVVLRDPSTTVNRRCKVVYSYKQNNNDELNLGVGDVIEVLEEVEEGWWRGRLNSNTGVFPSNFVVLLESTSPQSAHRQSRDMVATNNANNLKASAVAAAAATTGLLASEKDAPMLPPKPVRELCKVLYPYEPANGDELELIEGDIITIISKELPDKGWWKGELHGKAGVFPDNFVTLLPPDAAPVKSDRPTSMSKTKVPTVIALVANNNNNNNGTSNNNYHSNDKSSSIVATRKDSFGSKDSLTDSGIVTGNVAAHRRSLESKGVIDPVVDKPPRKSFPSSSNEKMSELRKSLECLDDKRSSAALPPPVLTKKPSVPVKKSPISGVTSNLLSGLKSKVSSVSSKTTVTETKDNLDGGGLSRMQVADNVEKHVHGERISMQSDFDQVERSTGVLKDMRANRAKLPKGRRPPSQAVNNSSSDLPNLLNGSTGSMDDSGVGAQPSATSSQSEDELMVKPKPREWEKNRAPWMAELKASQAKKTSPSSFDSSLSKSPDSRRDIGEEHQQHHTMFSSMTTASNENSTSSSSSTTTTIQQQQHQEKFDMSKSFSSSYVSSGLMPSSTASHTTAVSSVVGSKKLESLETTRSQSVDVHKSESMRSKSMNVVGHRVSEDGSSMTSTATITSSSASGGGGVGAAAAVVTQRPTSVNLRNHSISPIGGNRSSMNAKVSSIGGGDAEVTISNATAAAAAVTMMPPLATSNGIGTKSAVDDSHRIAELEQRVLKLEGTVQGLVRLLRDESDKVKTLKTELEKYAQCVTQV